MSLQNSSRLRLHTVIPFSWQVIAAGTGAMLAPSQNLEFLRASLLMEDHAPASTGDAHDETLLRIARLENRMDLLLQMTAQILIRQQPLPPAVAVEFGTESLQWTVDGTVQPPGTGDLLMLDLYLLAGFPFRLSLTAIVREVIHTESNGISVHADFEQMDETIRDILLRYIFRQHRRQIASTRS